MHKLRGNFQFHVRGMNDIFEPPSGDRVHSDGRTELLDELLDNAAAGIEIGGGQEAGMLIPRDMRGPACSALLPRPSLPPPHRSRIYHSTVLHYTFLLHDLRFDE